MSTSLYKNEAKISWLIMEWSRGPADERSWPVTVSAVTEDICQMWYRSDNMNQHGG